MALLNTDAAVGLRLETRMLNVDQRAGWNHSRSADSSTMEMSDLRLVHTTCVHGPCPRSCHSPWTRESFWTPAFTARGCQCSWTMSTAREHGNHFGHMCSRPVDTGGPCQCSWTVSTARKHGHHFGHPRSRPMDTGGPCRCSGAVSTAHERGNHFGHLCSWPVGTGGVYQALAGFGSTRDIVI